MSLQFLHNNKVLTADISLSTGTENAQFPLSNIKHDFTTKVIRSYEDTISLVFDLKEILNVDSMMIVGNNITGLFFTSATIQYSGSTNFTGCTEHAINLSQEHNLGYLTHASTNTARYIQLNITNTSGS